MTKNKLLAFALASSIAMVLTAQVASAEEGASCGNWSYNDSSCSAYIKPSGMKAAANEKVQVEAENCGDWSYNDPSCSAYIKPSGMKAEVGGIGSGNTTQCALGNFNATHC